MGGKTWSREEEVYFWHTIVPQSPKAARPIPDPLDWEQCATKMHQHFGRQARRNFTKLMLFEHYFQNVCTGHKSPRARDLVAEHMVHLDLHGRRAEITAAASGKTRGRRVTAIKPSYRARAAAVETNPPSAKLTDAAMTDSSTSHHMTPSFDDLHSASVIDFTNSSAETMAAGLLAPINETPSAICSSTSMFMGCGTEHMMRESYVPPTSAMATTAQRYHNPFHFNTAMTEVGHELSVGGYNGGRTFCSPLAYDSYNDSGYGTAATSPNHGSPDECH